MGEISQGSAQNLLSCQVWIRAYNHTAYQVNVVNLGWSLWLVPPPNSKVEQVLAKLICTSIPTILPQFGPVPDFAPHVTLTSLIDPSTITPDPQTWLDGLRLTHCEDVRIRFNSLVTEPKFFKRLFIRCEKDAGLLCVAKACRKWGVEGGDHAKAGKWLIAEYDPHCSLMYSDKEVTKEMMEVVRRKASEGIALMDEGAKFIEEKPCVGWVGGEIWLVPTDKKIEEWKPVARRKV